MKEETFEEFLGRMHMEDEPMTLDDDMQDAYERWLGNLDIEEMILYAEKWHLEQLLAALKK
mgnify:FL=1